VSSDVISLHTPLSTQPTASCVVAPPRSFLRRNVRQKKLPGAFPNEPREGFGSRTYCGTTTSRAKKRAPGSSDATVESSKRAVRSLDATHIGSRKAPGSLLTTRVGLFGAPGRYEPRSLPPYSRSLPQSLLSCGQTIGASRSDISDGTTRRIPVCSGSDATDEA
jgi:hypothetical protein